MQQVAFLTVSQGETKQVGNRLLGRKKNER